MIYKVILRHLLRRPVSLLFTLVAVAASLTMLGSVWVIVDNLAMAKLHRAEGARGSDIHSVTAFLDPDLSKTETDSIVAQIASKNYFSKVEIIPGDKALEILEAQFGETLSKMFGDQTLPVTLKLYKDEALVSNSDFIGVLNEIRSTPGVLSVDDGVGIQPGMGSVMSEKVFSWANGLLLLVFVVVALIVSHMIRIIFESMKPEVQTLKVLGAAKMWIFGPLLFQGLMMGILGSAVALAALTGFVGVVVPRYLSQFLPKGMDVMVLDPSSMLQILTVGLTAAVVGACLTWPLVSQPARDL